MAEVISLAERRYRHRLSIFDNTAEHYMQQAQAALNLTGERMILISKERFETLLKGRKYRDLADRVVKAQSRLGFVADEDEFKKLLAQKSNLDIVSPFDPNIQ